MFAVVMFAILPLKVMSSPSVMVSPVHTPADEGSHEPDLISLLQKTLSEVNAGDQSKHALGSIRTSNVSPKQKREANAHTGIDIQQLDTGTIIAMLCLALWVSVAISGVTVYTVHELMPKDNMLPKDYEEKDYIQKDYALKVDAQKDDAQQWRPFGLPASGDTIEDLVRLQDEKDSSHADAESTMEDSAPPGKKMWPAALMVPALSLRAPSLAVSAALLVSVTASENKAGSADEPSSSALATDSNSDFSVESDVVAFAPECRTAGHPDFSGTWKCIKVDGEIDSFLKDIGLGYMGRRAFTAWGCGAGQVVRQYTHKGHHVKIYEKGLAEEIQEWDIGNKEQQINTKTPFLQTTYWDKDNPLVLVMEAKDIEKKRPSTWTTSRQFFMDSKTFALQTTSPGGYTCRWVYERSEAADEM